jgi:hypothetical protein
VKRKRENEEEFYPLRKNRSPKGQSLHPCMRAFLCWLVEREREKEGGKLLFGREQVKFQDPQGISLISWKSRFQVL